MILECNSEHSIKNVHFNEFIVSVTFIVVNSQVLLFVTDRARLMFKKFFVIYTSLNAD